MDRYYPDLESLGLDFFLPMRVLIQQMINDPLYLERPECPYGDDTREALRQLELMWKVAGRAREAKGRERVREERTGVEKYEELTREAQDLYADLVELRSTIETEGDVKEKLAFFRTATALLDKLVALGERSANLKNISEYQARVLTVFEQVMDGEQRTRAMRVLEGT